MKSITVRTQEIDDINEAVAELKVGVTEQIELMKNSFGVLFYDPDFDAGELAGRLEDVLGFPVIGCSANAIMDNKSGYSDMDAVLIVLTADDCEFAADITDHLNDGDADQLLEAAYQRARNELTMRPELMFGFFQAGAAAVINEHTNTMSQGFTNIPIFGGLPTVRNILEERSTVIFNKKCYSNRTVILLISGNIKPLFAVANCTERFNEIAGEVTRSEQGCIYEVDNMPFIEFFKKYCDVDKLNDIDFYQTLCRNYPLLINAKDDGQDVGSYARSIAKFNIEDGSATCLANVPEGSKVTLGMLKAEKIGESVRDAIKILKQKSLDCENSDYHYSTIIGVSCISRREVLNPHFSVEGDMICKELPDGGGLSFCGFYSFGEIAPVAVKRDRAHNRLHNGSLVMCIF